MRVERWRKSSRELTFTFLYDHDDNAVLLREGALTLWDEQGRQIAGADWCPLRNNKPADDDNREE